jgi:uncharacterized protein YcfL
MQYSHWQCFKTLCLVGTILFVSACTSGITGNASYIDGRHEMSSRTDNAIVGMRVSIDDIKTSRVNDLMIANVQLRSKWTFTQDIKYRVHWFDKEGTEIEPERAVWNEVVLTGKSERTVKLTAPNSDAVELKVTVRD